MLTVLVATRIAARLLNGPVSDLNEINAQLARKQLPEYYLGGAGFNIEYRIANKPRYVWNWRAFKAELAEFYLY